MSHICKVIIPFPLEKEGGGKGEDKETYRGPISLQ
jgi:hypothetical protein